MEGEKIFMGAGVGEGATRTKTAGEVAKVPFRGAKADDLERSAVESLHSQFPCEDSVRISVAVPRKSSRLRTPAAELSAQSVSGQGDGNRNVVAGTVSVLRL